jgi:holo-[acyl-carrier protein] synthase
MVIGIGIDIVENSRIRESIERFGARFLQRIYTEGEMEYCSKNADPAIHYAARFAAKEAAFKALGTGWSSGVKWKDVEVERLASGKPELRLHGAALERATAIGATRFLVSLTHDRTMSSAVVVFDS